MLTLNKIEGKLPEVFDIKIAVSSSFALHSSVTKVPTNLSEKH